MKEIEIEYRCALCKEAFKSDRSEEEAREEYESLYKKDFDPAETTIVCGECYKRVIKYLKETDALVVEDPDEWGLN